MGPLLDLRSLRQPHRQTNTADSPPSDSLTISASTNQITGSSFAYDANGNMNTSQVSGCRARRASRLRLVMIRNAARPTSIRSAYLNRVRGFVPRATQWIPQISGNCVRTLETRLNPSGVHPPSWLALIRGAGGPSTSCCNVRPDPAPSRKPLSPHHLANRPTPRRFPPASPFASHLLPTTTT
jgi:hypothetical protein